MTTESSEYDNFHTEWCIWDNQRHYVKEECTSQSAAKEWIVRWHQRRSAIGDLLDEKKNPSDRFSIKSRRVTYWKKAIDD